MSETTGATLTALIRPQQWCGQGQPHHAHQWVNGAGFYAACAGHTGVIPVAPSAADDAGRP
jgi:hypothetical protein